MEFCLQSATSEGSGDRSKQQSLEGLQRDLGAAIVELANQRNTAAFPEPPGSCGPGKHPVISSASTILQLVFEKCRMDGRNRAFCSSRFEITGIQPGLVSITVQAGWRRCLTLDGEHPVHQPHMLGKSRAINGLLYGDTWARSILDQSIGRVGRPSHANLEATDVDGKTIVTDRSCRPPVMSKSPIQASATPSCGLVGPLSTAEQADLVAPSSGSMPSPSAPVCWP